MRFEAVLGMEERREGAFCGRCMAEEVVTLVRLEL